MADRRRTLPGRERWRIRAVHRAVAAARRSGDTAAITRSTATLEEHLARNVDRPRLAAECLFGLAVGRLAEFELTRDVTALDAAIAAVDDALARLPRRNGYRPQYLLLLGELLTARGGMEDLTRAVEVLIDAFRGPGLPDRTRRATDLATLRRAYFARFELTGAPDDLAAALRAGRLAVREATPGTDLGADCLTGLVAALLRVSGQDRGPQWAEEIVQVAEQAVRANARRRPGQRAEAVAALVSGLVARHKDGPGDRTAGDRDLDRALAMARAAMDEPDSHAVRTALAMALTAAYERHGRLADLNEAIDIARAELADSATSGDAPDQQATDLANLAMVLADRHQRQSDPTDLDEAIELHLRAVDRLPAAHVDRPAMLTSLAMDLRERWTRGGAEADLRHAVDAADEALRALTAEHPDRALVLGNYAAVMHSLAAAREDPATRDRAIEAAREAVTARTGGDPQSAIPRNNLALDLLERFTDRGAHADLDEAIAASEAAIAVTRPDHPLLGQTLFVRGFLAAAKEDYPVPGVPPPDRTPREYWQEAAALPASPPGIRAAAARRVGMEAGRTGDWTGAAAAMRSVVGLLEQTVPAELSRADASRLLGRYAGLGVDAAACCINAGDLAGAVEVWERSRAVLLGRALTRRRDLAAAQRQVPDLVARLTVLTERLARNDQELDRLAGAAADQGAGRPSTLLREIGDERRRILRERQDVLELIRERTGLATFLAPPAAADLLPGPDEGPVVVVNVSAIRCDALVLSATGVDLVPLATLSAAEVTDRANALLRLMAADQPDAGSWHELLGWLWDSTAEPVLAHLGIDGRRRPGGALRWCLSGPMSFLPLHAAGHHQTRAHQPPRTVLDRVDCSYAATLSALRDGDAAAAEVPRSAASALVVTMPTTEGQPDLPGAQRAADVLRACFPGEVETLTGPTRAAVATALTRHSWAHFACHSHNDLQFPWASALLLTDHASAPLSVAELSALRLPDARFAFLAACSTGVPGASLPDEAVHLASVLQLVGYRHVIATLWPVPDPSAHLVTKTVYERLCTGTAPDAGRAAAALAHATRTARERWPDAPWAWAGYLHFGAGGATGQ